MGAIAGMSGPGSREQLNDLIDRMLQEMEHRGPDGKSVWAAEDGSFGLGCNRADVTEPDEGRQVSANGGETAWIAFDGLIYNGLDLARELRQKGHRFSTHTDDEVVLRAYQEWGPKCAQRFNGVWAFAIWDKREKTLFCSRDRVGAKPFYYTWTDKSFAFASEIKALLAAGAVGARPDREGLRHYLTFQFCLGETTLFEGVKSLPSGHNLILRAGKAPQLSCYWDISFPVDEEHDESYFVDKLNWLLGDALRLRLRADGPVGVYLSGGLDSSAITCLTRLFLGDGVPIKTFTGAFREGGGFDETSYAKVVSKAAKTEYFETYISAKSFPTSIEKIIWHLDEPAAGPGVFPQYFVSKLAGEHVKVVLGGEGGDELFIGYARYLVAYLEECLKGAIEETAHRARYVATLETIVPSLPGLENYVPMLRNFWRDGLFDEPARRYFRLMDRFTGARNLVNSDLGLDHGRTFEEFDAIFNSHGAAAMINRIFCFDLKAGIQALLHVDDRMSAAWGLESHMPLLDHRLIELMASVPPVIKFKNGQLKYLFRRVVQNVLPPEIMARKDKMGFPVPLTQWAAGDLREFICDVLLSRRCKDRGIVSPAGIEAEINSGRTFGRSLWGALCLELWHRRFIDGPQA